MAITLTMSSISQLYKDWEDVNSEAQGYITTVMRLDDGYSIVRINTVATAYQEGIKMQNCLRDIYSDIPSDTNRGYRIALLSADPVLSLYSLRDEKNFPHATLCVENITHTLVENRMKQNKPPEGLYMEMVKTFVTESKLNLSTNCGHIGLHRQDGQLYELMDLPENFVWIGNFDISDNKNLNPPRLPRIIEGDMDIYFSGVRNLDDVEYVSGLITLQKSPWLVKEVAPLRAECDNIKKAREIMTEFTRQEAEIEEERIASGPPPSRL